MDPVYISMVSAAVAVISLFFNVATLGFRRRFEKSAEIARLHEHWWSHEMVSLREIAIEFVREWEAGGKKETPLLASYRSGQGFEEERLKIGRLAYFFADLNAFIDEGLASKRFAYRLFARAQFYYFSDFLLVAGNNLKERSVSLGGAEGRGSRWIEEVINLNKKFRKLDT